MDHFKKLAEEILRLHYSSKATAENTVNIDAKIIALVAILAEKGIISTNQFDKKHEEVKQLIEKNYKEFINAPSFDGQH